MGIGKWEMGSGELAFPRRCNGALTAVVLTIALAPGATAQTLRVRAIEAGTRQPIGGAIVVLLDSTNRRVAQGLTTESGRLVLHAPEPGRFRVRADRIGYPGILTDPVTLTDTLSLTLSMPAERVTLPELTVTGSTQCERRAGGERTAQLWEEVRKALAASQITSSAQSVELAVRRFRRHRTLTGALRSDSTVREFRTRVSPFVSVEPGALQAGGYVQRGEDDYQFFGPDARLLLAEDFLEDHCFQLGPADKKAPNSIGLAFRPVSGRKLPDIQGVLWVDRVSAELRHLEFEFVNVPSAVRVPGLGGRVEFERLTSGSWIVRDWYIRMPDRGMFERRATRSAPPVLRDTVVGYVDDGGVARPVGNPTVQLAEAAPQVRQATAVVVEVRGRVVSRDGAPIAGALVAVAELDSVLVTSGEGLFHLRDLPVGRLRLRIRAIGHLPFAAELRLSGERRFLDTTFIIKPAAQRLDSILVAGKQEVFRAGKLEEFERRREMGFGKFLTRAELHDPVRGGLDTQLRRFARINLVPLPWGCGGGYAAAAWDRLGGPTLVKCGALVLDVCFMSVYMDGALYWSPDMDIPPPDLSRFNPLTLEAAEVYRSAAEMPVEYNATNSACGVIVLWTRVG